MSGKGTRVRNNIESAQNREHIYFRKRVTKKNVYNQGVPELTISTGIFKLKVKVPRPRNSYDRAPSTNGEKFIRRMIDAIPTPRSPL